MLMTVVSVLLFIVGVVLGFVAGCLTRHCIARSKQITPAPPPAALYEEVVTVLNYYLLLLLPWLSAFTITTTILLSTP